MVGQIHGVIDKEDAWRMWKPYGERGDVQVEVDFDNLLPEEASLIVIGATDDYQGTIGEIIDRIAPTNSEYWLDKVEAIVAQGQMTAELQAWLSKAYDEQVLGEGRVSERISANIEYVTLLRNAIARARGVLFSRKQIDIIEQRLFTPDGMPYMEYCPVTPLHAARLWKVMYGVGPGSYLVPAINETMLGIIIQPLVWPSVLEQQWVSQHTKVHEHTHGFIGGKEIYDITMDNGCREAQATVRGVSSFAPTTKVDLDTEYAMVENHDLNEGWTDYAADVLIGMEPRLGVAFGSANLGYTAFRSSVAALHKNHPKVFDEITCAVIIDATLAQPDAKREALARMHEVADRYFGTPGALNLLMTIKTP